MDNGWPAVKLSLSVVGDVVSPYALALPTQMA